MIETPATIRRGRGFPYRRRADARGRRRVAAAERARRWRSGATICGGGTIICVRRWFASRAGTRRSSARCSRLRSMPSRSPASIFFNNETYLGMCGHGLIGVVRTLAAPRPAVGGRGALRHAGRHGVGRAECRRLGDDRERRGAMLTRWTSPSTCRAWAASSATLAMAATGSSSRTSTSQLEMSNVAELTRLTQAIQDAITASKPAGGVPIDHIELSGPRDSHRTPTPRTSCSARAANTIVRRAARERRR